VYDVRLDEVSFCPLIPRLQKHESVFKRPGLHGANRGIHVLIEQFGSTAREDQSTPSGARSVVPVRHDTRIIELVEVRWERVTKDVAVGYLLGATEKSPQEPCGVAAVEYTRYEPVQE